ncbi:MAG: hypothetical protein ACRCYU_11110 [Nocardioides sp.]
MTIALMTLHQLAAEHSKLIAITYVLVRAMRSPVLIRFIDAASTCFLATLAHRREMYIARRAADDDSGGPRVLLPE